MSTTNCPQCQQPLPADAPEGLCPACVLKNLAVTQVPPPVGMPPGAAWVDIGNLAVVAERLPQFEIIELLGRGGMGVVYKARQIQLDRIVALKILPPAEAAQPDFAARFLREARALAKLSHPNIVSVYDFGECNGLYFFTMEYVDGANLRALIQARQLGAAEALSIVPRICDALQFAHEEGVMHRDIKPENILLDKKGRVKIADFGLAKLLGRDDAPQTMLTLSGMTLGTPRYMAPEQIEKPESVDHRADIYSLGVVFYEMLTGELPMGRFALPSERVQVDVRLDEIVLRSLEKDVHRRYQHASEVRTDVENISAIPAGHAPAPAPVRPPVLPAPTAVVMPEVRRRWSVVEILAAITTLIAALCAGANGVLEMSRERAFPATPGAVIVAGICALVALAIHQVRAPAASRASLPGLCLCTLAVCCASLPWTRVFGDISGWNFWHGVIYAVLNLVAALLLFMIPRGWTAPRRGVLLLLTGAIGFAAVMIWNMGPVKAIGDTFITSITQKPALLGANLAAVISFLIVVAGALQLRNAAVSEASPPPPVAPEKSPAERLRAPAIGLLIGGAITVLLGIAFTILFLKEMVGLGTLLQYALVVLFLVVYVTLGVFIIRGALNMLNHASYGASRTGALCAIFAFNFVSPFIGIWAMVALTRPGARGAFPESSSTPKPAGAPKGFRLECWWHNLPGGLQKFLRATLCLILILSLVAFLTFEVKHSQTGAKTPFNNSDVTIGFGDPWYKHTSHATGFKSGFNLLTGSALLGIAALFATSALIALEKERKRRQAVADPAAFQPAKKFAGAALIAMLAFFGGIGLTLARILLFEEPFAYTFSGDKGWIKTPQGPAIGKAIADAKGITSTQVGEINKIVRRYSEEFTALERRHTNRQRQPNGRILVQITAFPEESLALIRKFADELRGFLGREVIPQPEVGKLMEVGLFRHAGEYNVRAELWREGAEYHFHEELTTDDKTPKVIAKNRFSRGNHSSELKKAFPEEYQAHWNEDAAPVTSAPSVEAPKNVNQ